MKFLEDPYLQRIETKVVKSLGEHIVTKDNIFYPAGGKDGDRGWVYFGKYKHKVYSVEKIGRDIMLNIGDHKLKDNDVVELVIDWKRRYQLMKMHSAAHLIGGLVYEKSKNLMITNEVSVKQGKITFFRRCISKCGKRSQCFS